MGKIITGEFQAVNEAPEMEAPQHSPEYIQDLHNATNATLARAVGSFGIFDYETTWERLTLVMNNLKILHNARAQEAAVPQGSTGMPTVQVAAAEPEAESPST